MKINALTLCFIVNPVALVDITIVVQKLATTIRKTVSEFPVVFRVVDPGLCS